MSFPLRPEHLAIIYDMLRAMPPFKGWKLPESDSVVFKTPMRKDVSGEYNDTLPHTITVSSARHSHFNSILLTLAHEMVHMADNVAGESCKSQHSAAFNKKAKKVCKLFGWDERNF
jgi:hypothetical protein